MGRERLRMTPTEVDAFLEEERVLRLATVGDDGWPAVVPVWYVWDDGVVWVWNLDRARRTARLAEGTNVAGVVDGGTAYQELRGIHFRFSQRLVPDDDVPERVRVRYAQRYFGSDDPVGPLDDHTWLELRPVATSSWDFRKVMGGAT